MMNYYQILGVSASATKDEIKRAYRRLAKEHHPDRNPNDKISEEIFKTINLAHETLIDDRKRKEYDQSLGSQHTKQSHNKQEHSRTRQSRKRRTTNFNKEDVDKILSRHKERILKGQFKMNTWGDAFMFIAVMADEFIKSREK